MQNCNSYDTWMSSVDEGGSPEADVIVFKFKFVKFAFERGCGVEVNGTLAFTGITFSSPTWLSWKLAISVSWLINLTKRIVTCRTAEYKKTSFCSIFCTRISHKLGTGVNMYVVRWEWWGNHPSKLLGQNRMIALSPSDMGFGNLTFDEPIC